MSEKKLIITPKTKIGELLDAYPELEVILMELSPAFSKLRNPVLRKTIARVASLQQAAVIGGLKVDELVNRLRSEAGQEPDPDIITDITNLDNSTPSWFSENQITSRFNATSVINSGESPMNDILGLAKTLKGGEILELLTPFPPAPIIDLLKKKGYLVFSVQKSNETLTYISQEISTQIS